MRKRTAILLSGALLCSIVGYVAWCFRPFYLPPPLQFADVVSPGGRKAVEEWRSAAGYPPPLEFSWSTGWWNLSHPWDCRWDTPVQVEERPDSGLWATDLRRFWGFSKTGGEWDASTAKDHGPYLYSAAQDRIHRQGEIASRIDAMGARGATIEVLSLRPLTHLGKWEREAGVSPDLDDAAYVFQHHEVLGRVMVTESRARQDLLDCLARSIREADVDTELPGWGISPRHGIRLTMGGTRAEYLINFDEGDGYAFGHGTEGIGGFYGIGLPPNVDRSEDDAFFRISSRYGHVFDAILDKHGVERVGPAMK